jgi:hypothetical protein
MLMVQQECKSSINSLVIWGQAKKLDSRPIFALVKKTSGNLQQFLMVVRIRGESKPGLRDTFEAAERLVRHPREDFHHYIISQSTSSEHLLRVHLLWPDYWKAKLTRSKKKKDLSLNTVTISHNGIQSFEYLIFSWNKIVASKPSCSL